MKLFRTIKGKLIVFTLCISLIPISIITVIYYLNARSTLKNQILNELTAIADSKKRHIQSFLEAKGGRLVDFGSDGFIRDCTEKIAMRKDMDESYHAALNNHLIINKKSVDPNILEVLVVDLNGKVIASTDKDHIGGDRSGEDYFTEVEFLNAFAGTPYYDIHLKETVIVFSTVLLSKVGREAIGVIVNRIRYEQQDDIGQKDTSFQKSSEWYYSQLIAINKARIIDFSTDGFIRDIIEEIIRKDDREQYYTDVLNTHLSVNKQPLDPDIISLFVVDLTGKIIGSTEFGILGKDVSGEVYFTEAMKHGFTINNLHYSPVVKEGSFEMAKLLYSKEARKTIGIIVIRFNGESIGDIVQGEILEIYGQARQLKGLRETGELYLVNKDKFMITGSRFIDNAPFNQVIDTEPVRKIIQEGKEMTGLYRDYRGVLVVGALVDMPNYGWFLLAEIDKAEAFAPLSMLGIIALLVGGVCAAVAIIGGIMFSLSAARPISKLKHAANRFADGSLEYRVKITQKDEIGDLAKSFNNMAGSLTNEIAEHKRAEEELSASNKELEAFCYSISHDLRAPLRSIDGFSKALLDDFNDKLDSQGKDYIKRVRRASQRMGQLINDLLGLSRITRKDMNPGKVDLSVIVQKIADELKEKQPERKVEFVIAKGVVVSGDGKLLMIALENLLFNAWKFTGKQPQTRIEFGITQVDDKPAYFISDNGAGFDMAYSNKLFGAFQRLHAPAEFEGTGIGLATVQRIIHRHGGHIWAKGEVGHGATFYFVV